MTTLSKSEAIAELQRHAKAVLEIQRGEAVPRLSRRFHLRGPPRLRWAEVGAVGLEFEQRFQLCPDLINHRGWGSANKSGSALLPRSAAQLIALYNPTYFATSRYSDLQVPIPIVARDWACHAAAGKLVECARRKHEGWAPPALLVTNRPQKIEPDHVA
jgi:hypothetical protein